MTVYFDRLRRRHPELVPTPGDAIRLLTATLEGDQATVLAIMRTRDPYALLALMTGAATTWGAMAYGDRAQLWRALQLGAPHDDGHGQRLQEPYRLGDLAALRATVKRAYCDHDDDTP
jgi:hypothetical protein